MYSFDELTDRTNTYSYKWDKSPGSIPMWVADMDFKTYPAITRRLEERISQGIYGYSTLPSEWNKAYSYWWKSRYGFTIDEDSLVFSTGVVPTISSVVRRLTLVGDKVVILTPVYNIFFNSILNNGREAVESRLVLDEDMRYSIDFEDLEMKLRDPKAKLLILCNPHNPVGRIWSIEELSRIAKLCKDNGVYVLSDEIHCDIVSPNLRYNPFLGCSEEAMDIGMMAISPGKTFNLAGIQTSAVVIPNKELRASVYRGLNNDEVGEGNVLSVPAVLEAYTEGGSTWVDELNAYIYENKKFAISLIEQVPELKVIRGDATYLLWVDISKITSDCEALTEFLDRKFGILVSAGDIYGGDGANFLRINIACPRERMVEGINRFVDGIRSYKGS